MKYLIKIWPWKRIHELEQKVSWFQRDVLEHYTEIARLKTENNELKGEIIVHQKTSLERDGHVKKMAQIIAIKGGIL
jgi:hypothetical protein